MSKREITDAMVARFKEVWHQEDSAGNHGGRVRAALDAVINDAELVEAERWRCLATGCNPPLTQVLAVQHAASTGHRVAKWPKRSAAGEAKARERNRTGYYRKYNGSDQE